MKRRRRSAWDFSEYKVEKPKQPAPREVPVFSECLIGYRVWRIDAFGRLRPQSVDQRPWQPGENEAACDAEHQRKASSLYYGIDPYERPKGPAHRAPGVRCACGLYARFDVKDVPEFGYDIDKLATPLVVGAVAAWGDVRIHHDGFRAQKACVVALARTPNMPAMVRELVEWVAEPYRVAVVDLADLEREAHLHGTPIPKKYRPAKPKPTSIEQEMLKAMGSLSSLGSSGSSYQASRWWQR